MITTNDFCEKIRASQGSMYALAYSILRNQHDAEDAIGETIVRAFSSLSQLRDEKTFKPWLLKILHNACLEIRRKQPATVDIDEQFDLKDDFSYQEVNTKLVLWQAVSKLRQPYRTDVILFYYENLSVQEIAGITNTSVVAVKTQLSRARKMLKDTLNMEDFYYESL